MIERHRPKVAVAGASIRLYGIDTPEKGQPHGKAAGKHLVSLIAGVAVEVESVTKDRYGRTVSIVSDCETNINQEMVQSGYAWVYCRYCDKLFCEYWIALESEAKTGKLGLWQEPDPIPPWEWRKGIGVYILLPEEPMPYPIQVSDKA
jgi:micrococcal nuclease